MRRVPSLPFQAPVASDNAAPQPESFRGRRSSKKSRLAAVRNMSSAYLTNTTNQSTYQPEGPQQYHPRPPSQSSTIYAPVPFFSKLKSISRAKSPIDAASLYSYTEPQSPGSIAGSVTPWSSDTAISTSPAQKKGGILSKKSLQRTTSGPDDEFDPTTLRQNRTWPRKNPEDIYHAYDDLFADDSVEESDLGEVDMPNTRDTHSVGSGDEYYPQQGLRQGNIRTPPKPQTPPRSAPSPRLDQYMANDYRRSPSPSLPQWRQLSETSTPPQSKPPSVVDCPVTSTAQPLYALPPTPPPKSTSPVQDQSGMERRSLSPLRVDGPLSLSPTELEDAIASPGPPPGHALPPVPPTRTSSKAKWGLKRSSMRRNDSKRLRDLEEGLGITNIQPSTMYPSEQSPPTETWEQSIGYSSEEGSAGDSTGVVSQSVISEIVYTHPGNETPSLLLNSSADFDTLPLFSQRASQPSSETIMGPEIISLAIGNSGKPPSTLRHRIPRKQVRSPQKAKALLDGFMSEARDISKLNEHTGYMPQMRIVDVQDIDSGFGYSNYKDTPVASPNTDTMKEVVSSSPEPALASAGMDTKEVVFEQPTVTGNTSGTEQGKEAEGEELCEVIEKPTGHDTTHYRVFRQFLKTSGENDAFIHRFPRFDALQAQRICTHLREEYPLVPKQNGEAAKASSKTRKMVRQREIGDQMLTSMWGLMAFRWLMFGRVILSPAYEGLAAASAERLSKRSSAKSKGSATGMIGSMTSDERAEGVRSRVLDLGGNPIGKFCTMC